MQERAGSSTRGCAKSLRQEFLGEGLPLHADVNRRHQPLVAVVSLATIAALTIVMTRLARAADELTSLLSEVRSTLDESVGRVSSVVDGMDAELRRVGGLVDKAETVSARAETLSRVTYSAVAKTVIKTAAVVKGTGRAARMLRRGGRLEQRAG